MATYRIVVIRSDPIRPTGASRCGARHSPAAVATVSKPTKAKNTTAAPRNTPLQP